MTLLCIIDQLKLEDAWLCAGIVRNFIWNYLSGKEKFDFSTDVDVVFYNKKVSYENTLEIQNKLYRKYPQFNWEVKNHVYMHLHNPNTPPYKSSCEAVSKFPEICTAIGVRLRNDCKKIEWFCPCGINDIIQFRVRLTPYFQKDNQRMKSYKKRVTQKIGERNGRNWSFLWITEFASEILSRIIEK